MSMTCTLFDCCYPEYVIDWSGIVLSVPLTLIESKEQLKEMLITDLQSCMREDDFPWEEATKAIEDYCDNLDESDMRSLLKNWDFFLIENGEEDENGEYYISDNLDIEYPNFYFCIS